MSDVVEQVRALAGRVAESYGLSIFDVQFRREGRGMVLRIQIDRTWDGRGPERVQDGVSIEDCASMSRDLSALLDVEDVVPVSYTLEISSPGLDRRLRTEADYRRFMNRRAKLVMREAVDGQMFFKGRLGGLEDGGVVIETDDGRRHLVPIGAITRANLEVEF
jgi:ribosome maturation factor RimP